MNKRLQRQDPQVVSARLDCLYNTTHKCNNMGRFGGSLLLGTSSILRSFVRKRHADCVS
jgi:hypothetical protein